MSIQCLDANGTLLSSTEIDAWELKASRRALLNFKTLLQDQQILALLEEQIQQGDAYFKSLISQSNGNFKEARVDFNVPGLKASKFLGWFERLGSRELTKSQRFHEIMAPSHPEHYSLGPYEIGVVETIGRYICRMRVDTKSEVPQFVKEYGDSSFTTKLPVTCYLDDGTVFLYGYQEIREDQHGCKFRIRILFPTASPQLLIDEHIEHLAIEFRYWIEAAMRSIQQ